MLLAATGGLWVARRVWGGYAPRPATAQVLRPREIALVAAVSQAIYPRGGAVEPSGVDAQIPEYADRYVAAVPSGTGLLMRLLFFLIEHATLIFPGRGWTGRRRFSALSEAEQVAVLEDWRVSPWFVRRLVFTSLRAILTMGYFADPKVLKALNLAPKAIDTPVVEADLLYPPIGKPKSAIRYTAADLRAPVGTPLGPDGPVHPDFEVTSS